MKLLFFLMLCSSFAAANAQRSKVVLYDTVYTKPEVLASYPGGDAAWKKYLKKHIKYPRQAWWDEVEADVAVKLVIEKDGTISEAIHLNMVGLGFEQEAIRLVMKSGKWKPAMYKGVPVKSEGQLVIPFRLK